MKRSVSIIILVVLLMTAIIPALAASHTHRYMTEGYQAPTCGQPGYSRLRCITCGYQPPQTTIPATGKHSNFGKWHVDKPASVFEEGKKKHQCGVCKKWIAETIPRLTPDWDAIHARYGSADLAYGNDNNDVNKVKNLQTDLKSAGCYTSSQIDGKYGSQTTQSVEMFKRVYKCEDGQNGRKVDDAIKLVLYYKVYNK